MTLMPEGYRHRLIEQEVDDELGTFGAVQIVGPKFCGKTWVALRSSNSAYMVGDTSEYGQPNADLVRIDLTVALTGDQPHLIDEWQEVPALWDAVRSDVDRKGTKGLYVLTGSSTPKPEKKVHSGTGRIRTVRMRTLSLFESGDSTGEVSLRALFDGKEIGSRPSSGSVLRIAELIAAGGWPASAGMEQRRREDFVVGYLDTVIEDACGLDDKHRSVKGMRAVVRSLARNETTMASVAKIQRDTGIPLNSGEVPLMLGEEYETDDEPAVSYNTVFEYMDALNRVYLLADQDGFGISTRSSARVATSSKRHLVDPSLAVAALGISSERLSKDLRTLGFLFESLCERDLQIYVQSLGGRLLHYRDSAGREIDSVVELRDGRWGAIEIKLGWNQVDSAASNLIRICDMIGSKPAFMCVLCGTTRLSYKRPDGVYVVSPFVLRNRDGEIRAIRGIRVGLSAVSHRRGGTDHNPSWVL